MWGFKKLLRISMGPVLLFSAVTGTGSSVIASTQFSSKAKDAFGDLLPHGATARLGTIRFAQNSIVSTLAFSPNGALLASGGGLLGDRDPTVYLWEVPTGNLIARLKGHKGNVTQVAFSPDGLLLASASEDKTICIWDVTKGQQVARFTMRENAGSVAFSADGNNVIAVGLRGITILTWNVKSKTLVSEMPTKYYSVCLNLSTTGDLLAIVDENDTVRLFDTASGNLLSSLKANKAHTVAIAIAPDGKSVLLGKFDHTIALWDVEKQTESTLGRHPFNVGQVIFSPTNAIAASCDLSGNVYLWDCKQKKRLEKCPDPATNYLFAVAFAADGNKLAFGGGAGNIRLWSTVKKTDLGPTGGHQDGVLCLSFINAGNNLVSAGCDKSIRIWNVSNGQETKLIKSDCNSVHSLAFTRAGDMLCCSNLDGSIGIYNNWKKQTPFSLDGTSNPAYGGACFFDNLIIGRNFAHVFAFDLNSRKLVNDMVVKAGTCHQLLAVPHRREIAFVHYTKWDNNELPGTLVLWDPVRWKETVSLGHMPDISCFNFSGDGSMVIVGERSGNVLLQELDNPNRSQSLIGPSGSVLAVAFSNDGRFAAAASKDHTVWIWETASGQLIVRLQGHGNAVDCVAFSSIPWKLASGGHDRTILLWDLRLAIVKGEKALTKNSAGELLWSSLANGNGAEGVKAIFELAAAKDEAVVLLKNRLKPVIKPDGKEWDKLIGDLNSEKYAIRETAAAELARVVELVKEDLSSAKQKGGSLEFLQRVDAILKANSPLHPGRLQALRGIATLEYIGTANARAVLQHLAKGDAQASVTKAAKAALSRSGT